MKPRGTVTMELDRPRQLTIKYRVISRTEELIGRPWTSLSLAGMGVREWAALFCAALQEQDDTVTLEQAYDLLDEYGLEPVIVKLTEAMASAWPKHCGGDKKK